MAVQTIFNLQEANTQQLPQTAAQPTLWNQLSPEVQNQIAQRLADLIQRMRLHLQIAETRNHEDE